MLIVTRRYFKFVIIFKVDARNSSYDKNFNPENNI